MKNIYIILLSIAACFLSVNKTEGQTTERMSFTSNIQSLSGSADFNPISPLVAYGQIVTGTLYHSDVDALLSLPIVFSVTGGGTYCQGNGGLPVGLVGSQGDANYQLYKDNVATGSPFRGTGSAISFGNQTAGTYTVKGTNGEGTSDMSGNAIIIAALAPVANAGADDFATAGVPYLFTGTSAANFTSVLWTKGAGTGTLSNETTLNPTYFQATSVNFSPVIFTLTVTGNPACPAATDHKSLYVFPASTDPLTWTGAVSNNWGLYSNWSATFVPGAVTDVTIPAGCTNYPVITSTALCHNITIASGASILDNGFLTVGGTATVNRNIAANEWHLISSPVAGAVSGMFNNDFLQTHTESTNQYTDITSLTAALTPMKGFALWGGAGLTAQFKGPLNTGAINIAVTKSGEGWNLVGNPYPSFIDWDAASGWTKTNVNNATYRHVNSSTWASYVAGVGTNYGTKYIAPGQGFFVSASAGGTLGMTNSVRVNNTSIFFKNTGSDTLIHNLVRLQVSGNGYADEAVVRFVPAATVGFDGDWDAYKLFGDEPVAAQIYTFGSTELAINSLPETNTVPLGIRAGTSGTYTIVATEVNDFANVSLEDTKTGIITNLLTKSYTFNFENGEPEQRFVLHFVALGIEESQNTSANIYSYNKTVYVNLSDQLTGDIYIYNIAGQLITSKLSARDMNEISISHTGTYIVKVISKESSLVRKVFIQ